MGDLVTHGHIIYGQRWWWVCSEEVHRGDTDKYGRVLMISKIEFELTDFNRNETTTMEKWKNHFKLSENSLVYNKLLALNLYFSILAFVLYGKLIV